MDHAAALGNPAEPADFSAQRKLHGNLFLFCVRGHDRLTGICTAILRQSRRQRSNALSDGFNTQRLADHTRGRNYHVFRLHRQSVCHQRTHLLGNLDTVCIAGIGIAAVTDDGLSKSVCNVRFGHCQGSSLD